MKSLKKNFIKSLLCGGMATFLFATPSPLQAGAGKDGQPSLKKVLLYDYRGANRSVGPRINLRKALTQMAKDHDFTLTLDGDPKSVNYLNLKSFDVVIFAYGEGNVVPPAQGQKDLERYVREGGGFVTVNTAAKRFSDFPFLEQAVAVQYALPAGSVVSARLYADSQAIMNPDLRSIFDGLPRDAVLRDRWLNFGGNPRENSGVTVLFSVDESSYPFGRMKGDHPIVWTQRMDKGRVVYDGLGHANVYAQEGDYGSRLLWNLMEYAVHKDAGGSLEKKIPSNAKTGIALEGRSVLLTLGEGSYSLRVSDFRGKIVLSKTFTGPGQFQTEPISLEGNYAVTLRGPSGTIQKQFTLK